MTDQSRKEFQQVLNAYQKYLIQFSRLSHEVGGPLPRITFNLKITFFPPPWYIFYIYLKLVGGEIYIRKGAINNSERPLRSYVHNSCSLMKDANIKTGNDEDYWRNPDKRQRIFWVEASPASLRFSTFFIWRCILPALRFSHGISGILASDASLILHTYRVILVATKLFQKDKNKNENSADGQGMPWKRGKTWFVSFFGNKIIFPVCFDVSNSDRCGKRVLFEKNSDLSLSYSANEKKFARISFNAILYFEYYSTHFISINKPEYYYCISDECLIVGKNWSVLDEWTILKYTEISYKILTAIIIRILIINWFFHG